jgi:hypothetical protein
MAKCKVAKKREVLSLIGILSYACKALRVGRSFLRRLIDLSMATLDGRALTYHPNINKYTENGVKKRLMW